MNLKKMTVALLLNTLAQFIAGVILMAWLWFPATESVSPMVWGCIGLILLSCLFSVIGVLTAIGYQNQNYVESMKNLENLNTRLREQKHDMMNHFQVVYGLMELGEFEEAHAYVKPVFRDIHKLNRALKTAQPAVNALLQAKLETAEGQGIDMYLDISSTLQKISMQPWDLCRVLANLIDNAITAVGEIGEDKRVYVTIHETIGTYIFEISNTGPRIPAEMMPHLFRAGFTTKKEEGHGHGLAIVSRLVKEAGGTVHVVSEEGMTAFTVALPK